MFRHDISSFSLFHLPKFLERTNYQNPEDPTNGPFQFAFETDLSFFQWLDERPHRLKIFNTWMEGHRQGRKSWFQNCPSERLDCPKLAGDTEAVRIVDVGGGQGHDLEAFRNAFPTAKGRLVLQDLPKTIDELPDHRKPLMEAIKYDFSTPQTVIGMGIAYCISRFRLTWQNLRGSSILLSFGIPWLSRQHMLRDSQKHNLSYGAWIF